jgi:4-amino-4-deoxy-L-arabinose transferase-like glycosyltransferase
MQATIKNRNTWLDHPLVTTVVLNGETIAFAAIILLGIFSRFYDLGARVMSHDENSHVYYSWRFYKGQGFAHDPLMHGPFQFHFIALSYFLFGDNDFTARILAATMSVLTVVFIWNYRRYLGRAGALIAATMMLISPYMLYYGRYVRNEAYVAFFGVVTLWAVLRYLETGRPRYLYWLTVATVLHFTAKETAFIYTAQVMVFLALYFVYRISSQQRASLWRTSEQRRNFMVALIVALLFLAILGGVFLLGREAGQLSATETAAPVVPGDELAKLPSSGPPVVQLSLAILGILALGVAGYFLLQGYTWRRLRKDRAFSMVLLLGTLVLPQLSAFPVRMVGWTHNYGYIAHSYIPYPVGAHHGCIGNGLEPARMVDQRCHFLRSFYHLLHIYLHEWRRFLHRHSRFPGLLVGATGGTARQPTLVLLFIGPGPGI